MDHSLNRVQIFIILFYDDLNEYVVLNIRKFIGTNFNLHVDVGTVLDGKDVFALIWVEG